ncbi:hypothetical protein CpMB16_04180 [Corynebacterium pseudotuberculosis]|uniref:(2Fe-2S)-binding protein n=1 Tax=Corynebacterium pseudotuberculosis TaxID=1719 RepID=UPI0012FB8474|nr:(2Fe-2S)-binding protein [Corynebacterium pseudotuberculosis]QGY55063.1 hypothetical protein CpMB16_04180 [Corynebacterium pseudotuberculosis]
MTPSASRKVERALDRVCAEHPRLLPSVTPAHQRITFSELCSPPAVRDALTAAKDIFKLAAPKHCGQLWLYTLMGDIVSPSVMTMVTEDIAVNLEPDSGVLFRRDDTELASGYWYGWRPLTVAESYRSASASLGKALGPLVETLCQEAGLRPAPLWAVIADGLVQPAMSAGNDELETHRALNIAIELIAGLNEGADAAVPAVRIEQIVNGQFCPLGEEEPDYLVAHRSSCCMIFHSPIADMCTSCPHQRKNEREAALVAASEFFS